jgi:hypothetical protein
MMAMNALRALSDPIAPFVKSPHKRIHKASENYSEYKQKEKNHYINTIIIQNPRSTAGVLTSLLFFYDARHRVMELPPVPSSEYTTTNCFVLVPGAELDPSALHVRLNQTPAPLVPEVGAVPEVENVGEVES